MKFLLKFIACAAIASVGSSAQDHLEWTIQRLEIVGTNPPPRFFTVAGGNGRYVALTLEGDAYSSPASLPLEWTARVDITNAVLGDIIFAEGSFRAVGREPTSGRAVILNSVDGASWTRQTLEISQGFDIEFGNGQFLGIGGDIVFRSPDGNDWTSVSNFVREPLVYLQNLTAGKGEFLLTFRETGPNQPTKIAVSSDGVNWQETGEFPTSWLIWDIAFGRNTYIALARTDCAPCGSQFISQDGSKWQQRPGPTWTDGQAIAYGSGVFAMTAEGNITESGARTSLLLDSSDGTNWHEFVAGGGMPFYDVTFGNNRFVAVGPGVAAISEEVRFRPLITDLQIDEDSIEFRLDAQAGTTWDVESSSNLAEWTILGTIAGNAEGEQTFRSANLGKNTRFLRAKQH